MILTHRPIGTWPGAMTEQRRHSPFRAGWSATLILLERELEKLDASDVVLQVALDERDIRLDGQPRANARAAHPGVILSFESCHGPLSYPCDTFADWRDNLRAIALALQALRAVDRYGVTKRAEQYRGWHQLGSGTPMGGSAAMTVEEAARLLADAYPGGAPGFDAILGELADPRDIRQFTRNAYRMGSRHLHPDAGGDPEAFRRLTEARDLLMNLGPQ